MAANVEDTLMAAYWRKLGRNMLRVTPKPVTPIGDRLTIKYLPVPRWSKRLRDMVVCEEDGTTVGDMYARLCADEARKHDPELQMVLYSSFNHTDDEPRFRVCIPSTHYVSPFVHEMLGKMIEDRLSRLGYGDQQSPRPHGIDTGKFERTSLFYRPSHRPGMFLAAYLDDRLPLDPYAWLNDCPEEVWRGNIHVEAILHDPSPTRSACPNGGGGLVQYGLTRWRQTGREPGGRRKFWYLAKCLFDAGLDRRGIEAHLTREQAIAHNPTERQAEIPGILDGFFG